MSAHAHSGRGWLKWIATIDFQVFSTFQVDAHLANGCSPTPPHPHSSLANNIGIIVLGSCCCPPRIWLPTFWRWQHLSGSALNFTEISINENAKKQIVSITEYCRFAFPPAATAAAAVLCVPNGFMRRIRDFCFTTSPSDNCNGLYAIQAHRLSYDMA